MSLLSAPDAEAAASPVRQSQGRRREPARAVRLFRRGAAGSGHRPSTRNGRFSCPCDRAARAGSDRGRSPWSPTGSSAATRTTGAAFTARSLTVQPDGTNMQGLRLRVEAGDDGKNFRFVRQLKPARQGWQRRTAGRPRAPPGPPRPGAGAPSRYRPSAPPLRVGAVRRSTSITSQWVGRLGANSRSDVSTRPRGEA